MLSFTVKSQTGLLRKQRVYALRRGGIEVGEIDDHGGIDTFAVVLDGRCFTVERRAPDPSANAGRSVIDGMNKLITTKARANFTMTDEAGAVVATASQDAAFYFHIVADGLELNARPLPRGLFALGPQRISIADSSGNVLGEIGCTLAKGFSWGEKEKTWVSTMSDPHPPHVEVLAMSLYLMSQIDASSRRGD